MLGELGGCYFFQMRENAAVGDGEVSSFAAVASTLGVVMGTSCL